MLRLHIDHLQPGLITARNLYNTNGTLLLAYETILDDRMIARLKNAGIESVYIQNPYIDAEPPELIREETRVHAVKVIRRNFEMFAKNWRVNIEELKAATGMIIKDVIKNKNILIHLHDIRTHDNYTFSHSVSTCMMSVLIGIKMKLGIGQINHLALGSILHDIGKTLLPNELLNKQGPFTAEEWRIIQRHSVIGFNMLKETAPAPVAHVAYEHHENYDGSGYPNGVCNENIHQYAQIVAVADTYDAISSDRPYRPAMLPHEAHEIILGSSGMKLNPKIVEAFLDSLTLYPVGSLVQLDTEEIGVVIQVYPKLQSRPVVRIVKNIDGKKVYGRYVNLTIELTRFIVKVFKPEEIVEMN